MTERCEDCAHSRASDMKGGAPVEGWLQCDQKASYIYLSAPLAECTFEPSRFVQKRGNLGAAKTP